MQKVSTAITAIVAFGVVSARAASPELDAALDRIAPDLKKWGTVCEVTTGADGKPVFTWTDYHDTGEASDFWPCSTIKIYAVVGALELLNEKGFPFETTSATFEHREADGRWVLDCSRGVREMISEVFRRSSNEDYTLLLRLSGLDRLNTKLLTPERGFAHSALMRGYVAERPWVYRTREPQRITLHSTDGKSETIEHTWSGHSYAEDRGRAIFDTKTGNLTTPRDLAECLRRVLFHEQLPEAERYHLTAPQLDFLRHGADGFSGLESKSKDSYAFAWTGGVDAVFPNARFFHKSGLISNYALELAFVDDAASGKKFILVPVVAAGSDTKPESGEALIAQMARAMCEWVNRK